MADFRTIEKARKNPLGPGEDPEYAYRRGYCQGILLATEAVEDWLDPARNAMLSAFLYSVGDWWSAWRRNRTPQQQQEKRDHSAPEPNWMKEREEPPVPAVDDSVASGSVASDSVWFNENPKRSTSTASVSGQSGSVRDDPARAAVPLKGVEQQHTSRQSLAPAGLAPQERQRFDRIVNRLIEREVCSVCDKAYLHNSRLAYGFDHVGEIIVAGECCIDEMTVVFGYGHFSERHFSERRRRRSHRPELSTHAPGALSASPPAGHKSRAWDQIDEAIALRQKAIDTSRGTADEQQVLEKYGVGYHAEGRVERHGGVTITGKVLLELSPLWGIDDRTWFEKNPTRSHRARMPFAGEDFLFVTKALPGCTGIVLVRQIKPGSRQRLGFDITTALLPLPDDEAQIHALFEIASKREPAVTTVQALCALRDKYTTHNSSSGSC
jgi:hypothetical protein